MLVRRSVKGGQLRFAEASLRRATALVVRLKAERVFAEPLEGRTLLASPAVSGLTLINADTDVALATALPRNGTVTIDLKAARHLNIRADVTAANSVRFGYDGQPNYHTESGAPFAFASNDGSNYFSWTPTVGTHTVSATAYAGASATSTASGAFNVTLKIIDSSTGTPAPPTGGSTPYGTVPNVGSQTVFFDNFDNGGEGVAYHDSDSVNAHGEYRSGGVDIETNADVTPSNLASTSGAGKSVGNVRPGEYLKYTVNVATAGTYRLSVRFASAFVGGSAHLDVDGMDVSGTITLTGTGGWQSWKTIEKTGIALPAGKHVLKFAIDSSASTGDVGNLYWFKFTADSTPANPLTWPTSWSAGPSAPSPRFESAGHVFGGKIYSFGGFKNSDFDVDRTYVSFDPNTNTWTKLGTLPVGMAETHTGVADDGHYIYFVGGFAGDFRHGQKPVQIASDKVWRFEPSTNTWKQIATLPFARGAGGAAIVDGKLHYMGGNPADRVTNIGDHIVLDLNNPSAGWKTLASEPDPKDHASVITIGTKIYVIGGEHGHDQLADTQKDVHVYDTRTNAWTRLADMPLTNSHSEGGTFVLDGQIVFAGGQDDHAQQSTNRVVAYNPATNTWKELAPLPAYRQGAIIGVFGNKVVLTLGAQHTNSPQATTWIGYR